MSNDVTLSEAIRQLRLQLEEAQRESENGGVRFIAKSIDVELGIVFKKGIEGGAGIKAWFLDASSKIKSDDETTHKIKLVLEPIGDDGSPTIVSDHDHEK
ncbi:trypco2 family protein [Methylobacterium oryzisoli]|uniref:trypco2 family protein n=1 Tax=Methylobacterium oryzisoli TaxID=3385502 RepID=UPI003891C2F9